MNSPGSDNMKIDIVLSPTCTITQSNSNSNSNNDQNDYNSTSSSSSSSTSRRYFGLWITAAAVLLVLLSVATGLGVTLSNNKNKNKNSSNNEGKSLASITTTTTTATSNTADQQGNTETLQTTPSPLSSNSSSRRPSLQPSLTPSSQPSLRPSSTPSTTTPSAIPSATHSLDPTASPTRPILPDGFTFRLKMHWQPTYFWQEEADERQWCIECTTCEELSTSDWGEGCYDSDNDDGSDCKIGDQLWIQNCNGWEGSRGNTEFEIVRGPVADQLKVRRHDLCLTRASNLALDLQRCDPTGTAIRQLWTGFDLVLNGDQQQPFDLRPLEQNWRPNQYEDSVAVHRCLSQHHYPKKYEMLYLVDCNLAHLWDTALWETL